MQGVYLENSEDVNLSETIFINFMANIDEKSSSILLASISDSIRMGVKKIRINISSPGGSIFHAISLYNFILGLKGVEIHTHNFGQVDSAAIVIFLSAKKRTCSSTASFLFHGPSKFFTGPQIFLNKKDLSESLESLETDIKKLTEIISKASAINEQEIAQFFEKQKTMTAIEAKNKGLVQEIVDFTASSGSMIINITNIS